MLRCSSFEKKSWLRPWRCRWAYWVGCTCICSKLAEKAHLIETPFCPTDGRRP